jgi:hypothetical protein
LHQTFATTRWLNSIGFCARRKTYRFCIVNGWCCGRARPEKAAGRVAVAQRTLFSTSETGVTMEAWNSARTSDFNIGRPCPKSGLTELPNLGKLGS